MVYFYFKLSQIRRNPDRIQCISFLEISNIWRKRLRFLLFIVKEAEVVDIWRLYTNNW